MSRSGALVVRAFAVWTLVIWGTRIWNIVGDDTRSAGFKAVHIVLALVSVVLAVASLVVVHRARARAGTLGARP